jgi:hypothetical protein
MQMVDKFFQQCQVSFFLIWLFILEKLIFAHGINIFKFFDNPFPKKFCQNFFQLFKVFSAVLGKKKYRKVF